MICIHEKLFNKFAHWYGIRSHNEHIPYRKVYAIDDKETSFDLYPPSLHLIPKGDHKELRLECYSNKTIGKFPLLFIIIQGFVKSYIRTENDFKSDIQIDLFDAANKDRLTNEDKATLKECSLEGEKVTVLCPNSTIGAFLRCLLFGHFTLVLFCRKSFTL